MGSVGDGGSSKNNETEALTSPKKVDSQKNHKSQPENFNTSCKNSNTNPMGKTENKVSKKQFQQTIKSKESEAKPKQQQESKPHENVKQESSASSQNLMPDKAPSTSKHKKKENPSETEVNECERRQHFHKDRNKARIANHNRRYLADKKRGNV